MDPIARLELIMGDADPLARTEAWLRFVRGLNADNIEDVVAHFRAQGMTRDNMSEYSMLLTAWAKMDPLAAIDYASENTGTPFARQTILATWSSTDLAGAMMWAESNHEGDGANPWMVGVIRGIASADPVGATQLLNDMPYSRERGQALAAVQAHYLREGPDAARVWAMSIEDERLREGAILRVASDLARSDPKGTADWLISNPSDGATRAMSDVMGRMAADDLPSAITYFDGIADVDVRGRAFAGIANQIAEDDPVKAANFIDTHESLATDDVYERFVWNARRDDPVMAADYISRVGDPEKQTRLYQTYLKHWMRRDLDGAVDWFNKADLSERMTKRLGGMVNRTLEQQQ